jgi:hypothetical protein
MDTNSGYLAKWIVSRDFFERWVNVLSENDNSSVGGDVVSLHEDILPDGLLTFY